MKKTNGKNKSFCLKTLFSIFFLLCLFGLVVAGCRREKPEEVDKVLAVVGGVEIKESDFLKELEELNPNQRSLYERERMALLNILINDEVIFQEAVRRKLQEEERAKKEFADAKKNILLLRVQEKEVDEKISVSKQEIQETYEADINRPGGPQIVTTFRIYYIPVTEENWREIEKQITEGREEGLVFRKIARKYKIPYRIVYPPEEVPDLPPELIQMIERMSERMKIKEISRPSMTPAGGFVLYKEPTPLEDCFREVHQVIWLQKREKAYEKWFDSVKESASIERYLDALKDLSAEDSVLANVNDVEITVGDFNKALEEMPSLSRQRYLENKENFLELLINTELLYQKAVEEKLLDDEVVQSRIKIARRRILINRLVDMQVYSQEIEVTEEEITEWFKKEYPGIDPSQIDRDAVRHRLIAAKRKKLYDDWIERIKPANIKIYSENLKGMEIERRLEIEQPFRKIEQYY